MSEPLPQRPLARAGALARSHPRWTTLIAVAALGFVVSQVPGTNDTSPTSARSISSSTSAPESVRSEPDVSLTPTTAPSRTTASRPTPSRPTPTAAPKQPVVVPVILTVTHLKDGDSWDASDGHEYRLGLVNAPEYNEPCGTEAKAFTRSFLGGGFRAKAYSKDTYGRLVSEVFDTRGRSLNVALAASGLGNDKYLAQFRHENPDLAARLDAAFATAPTPACLTPVSPTSQTTSSPPEQTSPATTAPTSSCHPDYVTCIPIKGDGSGAGSANDLDCSDIRKPVELRNSNDPYRLDSDGDGWGCESWG